MGLLDGGLDMEELRKLAQQFGPTDEDRRKANMAGLLSFGLQSLAAPRYAQWQGIANAAANGMASREQTLQDAIKMRGQGISQAAQIMPILRQVQAQRELLGDVPQSAPQSVPQSPGIPQGNGVTTYPYQPDAAPAPTWPGLRKAMLDAGVSEAEIRVAAASKDPMAAALKLLQDANKPMFGQGQIPIVRGPNGSFRASVPQGYNEALTAQTAAQEEAKAGVASRFKMIPVPIGNGQTQMMSEADALKVLQGGQSQRPPPIFPDAGQPGGLTPQQVQRALADNANNGPISTPQIPGMGGVGVTPSPLATKAGEATIDVEASNRKSGYNSMIENSKTMYADMQKNFQSAKAMANHAANMEKADKGEIFSGPGGALMAGAANWFNSLVPGANIAGDKLANTQYAQAEISKMQQALGKAFPGQQSNYELQTVTNSLPTLMATPEGRQKIYAAIKQAAAYETSNYRSASQHMQRSNGMMIGYEPPDYPSVDQFQAPKPTAPTTKNWIYDPKSKRMVAQ